MSFLERPCLTWLVVCILFAATPGIVFGDLVVDLLYNPHDGNVHLDTNGLDMASFTLQNSPGDNLVFNTTNTSFADLPTPLFPPENLPTQIGWVAQDLGTGFNGVANMGDIFPLGLTQIEVEKFTTIPGTNPVQGRLYSLAFPPGGGGSMNVQMIPESSSFLLVCFVCTGLAGERCWRKLATWFIRRK